MNSFDYTSDKSIYQKDQICAFAGCKRLAQISKDANIIPLTDANGIEIPNSDHGHHACCSRKHEKCFHWRVNYLHCLNCGIPTSISGSLITWCCGKNECKRAIVDKMYFNHTLRYTICIMNCVVC